MYERLIKDYGSRGSAAEIWIDKDARLVKKYYKVNGIGCMGKTIVENDYAKLKELWTNEITWNSKFGKFSVPIVDYGDLGDSFFVVQEYYAPDLLVNYMNKTLHQDYPDIKQQVIEFFEMCKDLNVYKYNHSMSNMTGVNGQLKVFDYKYVELRQEENRSYELRAIREWLSKIDATLVTELEKLV